MELPRRGDTFEGKYIVGETIDDSGFACVFRAVDPLDRVVALKVLKPGPAGYRPDFTARFMREARAVASLTDRHTLILYQFGRSASGLLYMAFEYVDGEDLFAVMKRRGVLGEGEVASILGQALQSLREAHAQGFLHRDITPASIHVFEYMGRTLNVKVGEFGLAKSVAQDDGSLTRTGQIAGSPRFMSPEQLAGRDLGPTTDLYSLGLVAFDLLFGASARRLGERPRIPPDAPVSSMMRGLLDRLLAADPQMRVSSAAEALEVLGVTPSTSGGYVQVDDASQSFSSGGYIRTRSSPSSESVSGSESVSASHELEPKRDWRWQFVALIAMAVAAVVGVVLVVATPAPQREKRKPLSNALLAPRKTKPVEVAVPNTEPIPKPRSTEAAAATPGVGACAEPPPFTGAGLLTAPGAPERLPVYIPGSYEKGVRHGLLIVLHDDASDGESFMTLPDITELADLSLFVVFGPDDGLIQPWRDRSDVYRVADDARAIMEALCIDGQRVFVLGHGHGGRIAGALPCSLPVAGVATSNFLYGEGHLLLAERSLKHDPGEGGLPNDEARVPLCVPNPRVPRLFIVGNHDPLFPLGGKDSCLGRDYAPLARQEQVQREMQGCEKAPQVIATIGKSRCTTWHCDTPFVSCTAEGGHSWASMPPTALDNSIAFFTKGDCSSSPADFPYAQTIFRFFLHSSEPGHGIAQ